MYARRVMCLCNIDLNMDCGVIRSTECLFFVVQQANSVNGVNIHRKWHSKKEKPHEWNVNVFCASWMYDIITHNALSLSLSMWMNYVWSVETHSGSFCYICNGFYRSRCAWMLKRSELLYTTSTYTRMCWNARKSS